MDSYTSLFSDPIHQSRGGRDASFEATKQGHHEDTKIETEDLDDEGTSAMDTNSSDEENTGPTLAYRLKDPEDPIKRLERENRGLIAANQDFSYNLSQIPYQDPVHELAAQIHNDIISAYDEILQNVANHPYPQVAVFDASDTASKAMVPYIQQIDQLSKMEGGLDLALGLIRYLGTKSYVAWTWDGKEELEMPAPPVEKEAQGLKRESDRMADEIYVRLLKMKKEVDKNFWPVKEFGDLERERELLLKRVGVGKPSGLTPGYFDSYFPGAWLLMKSIVQAGKSLKQLATKVDMTQEQMQEQARENAARKYLAALKRSERQERFEYLVRKENAMIEGDVEKLSQGQRNELAKFLETKKLKRRRKEILKKIPAPAANPNIGSTRPSANKTGSKPRKLSKPSRPLKLSRKCKNPNVARVSKKGSGQKLPGTTNAKKHRSREQWTGVDLMACSGEEIIQA